MIKIEQPETIHESDSTIRAKSENKGERAANHPKRAKLTKEDLPVWMRKNDRWRRVFLPTFLRLIGNSSSPWIIHDDVLIDLLQHLVDAVYKDFQASSNYVITRKDVVFELVSAYPYHFIFKAYDHIYIIGNTAAV